MSMLTLVPCGAVASMVLLSAACLALNRYRVDCFGRQVMSFATERELLLRWRDLVVETDPDLIIGYNIVNFDLPYLIDRARALRIPDFNYWGRIRNKCACAGLCFVSRDLHFASGDAGGWQGSRDIVGRLSVGPLEAWKAALMFESVACPLPQGAAHARRHVQQQGIRDAELQGDHHRRPCAVRPVAGRSRGLSLGQPAAVAAVLLQSESIFQATKFRAARTQ